MSENIHIKIVTVSQEYMKNLSYDKEMLDNNDTEKGTKRPHLITAVLEYKGEKHTFAIPIRTNIASTVKDSCYFGLPVRAQTQEGKRHGLHFQKMYPIDKKYTVKFEMNTPYYKMLSAFIEKNMNKIVNKAQNYLDNYALGHKEKFCTDIDKHIETLKTLKEKTIENKVNERDIKHNLKR